MTSFTRKLYVKSPSAAKLVEENQRFEHRLIYGRRTELAMFTPLEHGIKPCRELCGAAACKRGCSKFVPAK